MDHCCKIGRIYFDEVLRTGNVESGITQYEADYFCFRNNSKNGVLNKISIQLMILHCKILFLH